MTKFYATVSAVTLSLATMSFCLSSHCAAENLDPKLIDEIGKLAVRYADDNPDPYAGKTPEQRLEQQRKEAEEERLRLDEIRNRPGITPYLFYLLKYCYKEERSDGTSSVLQAIALRNDLTQDQFRQIAEEVKSLLLKPYVPGDWLTRDFLHSAVLVLANAPSIENEKLVLAALDRGPDGSECLDVKSMAIAALAKFGSKDSLVVAKEKAARLIAYTNERPMFDSRVREIEADIQKYEQRLSGGAGGSARSSHLQNTTKSDRDLSVLDASNAQNTSKQPMRTARFSESGSLWLWVIGPIGLLAAGVIVLTKRRVA